MPWMRSASARARIATAYMTETPSADMMTWFAHNGFGTDFQIDPFIARWKKARQIRDLERKQLSLRSYSKTYGKSVAFLGQEESPANAGNLD
jgi:hypothetical protein